MPTEIDKEKAKIGRPRIEIDQEQFEYLCSIFCTLFEISGFFRCSPDTIERWCKRTYGRRFAEVSQDFKGIGKTQLRKAQFQKAVEEKDTKMLIHLGKYWLGQTDGGLSRSDEKALSTLHSVLDKDDDEEDDEE